MNVFTNFFWNANASWAYGIKIFTLKICNDVGRLSGVYYLFGKHIKAIGKNTQMKSKYIHKM